MSRIPSVALPVSPPTLSCPAFPDPPQGRRGADELARLQLRCRSRELALERVVASIAVLRRANDALRAENRELAVQLDRLRRTTR